MPCQFFQIYSCPSRIRQTWIVTTKSKTTKCGHRPDGSPCTLSLNISMSCSSHNLRGALFPKRLGIRKDDLQKQMICKNCKNNGNVVTTATATKSSPIFIENIGSSLRTEDGRSTVSSIVPFVPFHLRFQSLSRALKIIS